MKFSNPIVIHYVRDMERARQFYQDAFGVPVSVSSPGWSMLDFGDFELALHILYPGHDGEGPLPHAGLNLEVELIEAAQAEVEAAGGKMIELREAEPHIPVRVASFLDPDGNGFELRQNVAGT
jgi:predicted enzyme related to lactoylglutathione lyase